MEIVNTPSISVSEKSNEQNIQALKSWANNMTDAFNFYITSMQSQLDELKKEIQTLKGE